MNIRINGVDVSISGSVQSIRNDSSGVYINGKKVDGLGGEKDVIIEGDLNLDGNLKVESGSLIVKGNVTAKKVDCTNIDCGDVAGDIDATNVTAKNVAGDIDAVNVTRL